MRQVDPMRESLELGSYGGYKNYFKGALPFRGKVEGGWSGEKIVPDLLF